MDDPAQDAPPNAVDAQLLALVAKRDLQAFGRLYDASSTVLFTLAMRMLGERDEAAETLQEVYLEIGRKAARYDVSRGTPMAWLVALTRTRALERLRARAQRTGTQSGRTRRARTPVLELPPPPLEPSEETETRKRVAHAWAGLSSGHRQVLEWGYFDGLTYLEIAARLDEPPASVSHRIREGMEELRTRLRTAWDAPPRYGT